MPGNPPGCSKPQEQRLIKDPPGGFFYTPMCGRYTLVSKLEVIADTFHVNAPFLFDPNPNIGPGELAPVITQQAPDKLQLLQFGLQPTWAQKPMLLINARTEGDFNQEDRPDYHGSLGIFQKPAFRSLIRTQRCLIPANAFIEGPKTERLDKPYLVFPTQEKPLFAFAGIWCQWNDIKTNQSKSGFSILTTPPLPVVSSFGHHRSPLVLATQYYRTWLNNSATVEDLVRIIRSPSGYQWNAYPIGTAIKKQANKSLEVLLPAGPAILPLEVTHFSQQLKLAGMGSSPARERRQEEDRQLRLF